MAKRARAGEEEFAAERKEAHRKKKAEQEERLRKAAEDAANACHPRSLCFASGLVQAARAVGENQSQWLGSHR